MSAPKPLLPALVAAVAIVACPASAGEASHYTGGSFNPRDFLVPEGPASYIVAPYAAGFKSRALRDSAGEKVTSVGNANLDLDVSTWQTMVMFIGYPNKKVLGANYGFMGMLAYGETTVAGRLSQIGGDALNFNSKSTGVMDLMVQPVMLTWVSGKNEFGVNYAFWAPTGNFNPEGGGVGLGYWTHLFRATAAHSFDEYRMRSVTATVSYDLKSKKKGLDLRPGAHLNVEAGYNHVVSASIQTGVFIWGTWQVSDDAGAQAARPLLRDRVYGAGAYFSYWFKPGVAGALLRYTGQFGARDQFEGDTVALGINLPF
ncbi:transporter [Nibricoccus sp. IMCC34717]|uniref:SphA family protein n=1 Tax=Nibricoccus sp. IMCC34717 TaxID=3034021 RepID=UPI00384D9ACF